VRIFEKDSLPKKEEHREKNIREMTIECEQLGLGKRKDESRDSPSGRPFFSRGRSCVNVLGESRALDLYQGKGTASKSQRASVDLASRETRSWQE